MYCCCHTFFCCLQDVHCDYHCCCNCCHNCNCSSSVTSWTRHNLPLSVLFLAQHCGAKGGLRAAKSDKPTVTKKPRIGYCCKICGQPSKKIYYCCDIIITETGHTQFRGKRYCPKDEACTLMKDEWLEEKRREAAAAASKAQL